MYDQQQGNSMRAGGILGIGSACEPMPPKDVMAAVETLSNAVSRLGDVADNLRNRLSPVLSAPCPPAIGEQKSQSSSTVPLADQLYKLAEDLNAIRIGTLHDALDRLAV